MAGARQYNVYGAEFRVESDFPKLLSELDRDFGLYPSRGLPASGFACVKKEADVLSRLPEHALIERKSEYSTVFSLDCGRFITDAGTTYIIHIPSPGERKFFCYARKYSHQLFCTVRNITKYLLVSLLEDEGVHYIHGAAVSRKDKAAVVFARSGAGKTRALLSLIDAGFKLSTDDLVLLKGGDFRILPFVVRGNVDKGHIEAFPKLGEILLKRKVRLVKKWNFWFLHLTDLFEAEQGNPRPHVLVNLVRWNARESSIKDADKEKTLAALLAAYREFGSGVYFNSGKTRADVFNFYSKLLEKVRAVDFYAGSDPKKFAQEFEKLFT